MLMKALNFILIIGTIEFFQANSIPEKSAMMLHNGKSRSEQEKSKYKYVGIEKCASVCHNTEEMGFQYDIMKNGPHSKAFKILISEKARKYAKNVHLKENPQESSACLKCHITGGDLDSTFFASSYKKDDGVTCESCHKREFITKSFLPQESDCLKCHNNSVHKMNKFDFADKCLKIAHPRPGAKQKAL
jgi:hypothetical protein